jgi:hypothetical protein
MRGISSPRTTTDTEATLVIHRQHCWFISNSVGSPATVLIHNEHALEDVRGGDSMEEWTELLAGHRVTSTPQTKPVSTG